MIEHDYKDLPKIFSSLDTKKRTKALKGAFRKAANKVKKTAVNNLRTSGIHTSRSLEKGVRSLLWKKKAGFRVTIGTKKANKNGKGASGWHTNRRGQTLPILIWLEKGTEKRHTKTRTKNYKRKRKGHFTGRINAHGFMDKAKNSTENTVSNDLRKAIEESVMKIFNQYGNK